MMRLPSVERLHVQGKKVLLRTDYDVTLQSNQGKQEVADDSRILESLPTIEYLLKQNAFLIVISHLGRPEGKVTSELSLEPVARNLGLKLGMKTPISTSEIQNFSCFRLSDQLILLENIRFFPEEEKNNLAFAKRLASLGDCYVNDAFAVSHRQHASIVGLPQFLPSAFGFDFLEEIKQLSSLREKPKRPVVLLMGGTKADKLEAVEKLQNWADRILIGGRLPILIVGSKVKVLGTKVVVGQLNNEGKDITLETATRFRAVIAKAGTVIWAGPMGVYEEESQRKGTEVVAQAVVDSGAFSVVGGGDTEAVLTQLGLEKKIKYISSGGGAMLEFLADGTLPAIKAVLKKKL